MRRSTILPVLMVVGLSAFLMGSAALASGGYGEKQSPAAKTSHKPATTEFLIEATHTPDECLQALDAISTADAKMLPKWEFGCMAGDHTGWLMVNAVDEQAALQMIPASLRDKAKVHKLNRFTVEQIKALHEMKK